MVRATEIQFDLHFFTKAAIYSNQTGWIHLPDTHEIVLVAVCFELSFTNI